MKTDRYIVIDNEFNQYWNKSIIGKVYFEKNIPSYTIVEKLTLEKLEMLQAQFLMSKEAMYANL